MYIYTGCPIIFCQAIVCRWKQSKSTILRFFAIVDELLIIKYHRISPSYCQLQVAWRDAVAFSRSSTGSCIFTSGMITHVSTLAKNWDLMYICACVCVFAYTYTNVQVKTLIPNKVNKLQMIYYPKKKRTYFF